MIDWNRVKDLRDEIGADSLQEVVGMFLEEADAEVAGLRDDPRQDALESRLHALKGSALNLGFAQFSEKCQAGETAAAAGAAEQVDIADILASYDTSKAVFLEGLGSVSPA
ncbi:Hpt domain-containing protein [Roseovarius sp. A21]|uniref:Hpt domain-containing protein n=2 Tax=Roseovarius bejariae TaxID=2576383 RepID=A0A844CWP6_9RHOB|nr:Hpt domain-containing protein [Roseovarius bejariae]MRU15566.1 Hpt domain-containing protein [Roseovarius bejariae]